MSAGDAPGSEATVARYAEYVRRTPDPVNYSPWVLRDLRSRIDDGVAEVLPRFADFATVEDFRRTLVALDGKVREVAVTTFGSVFPLNFAALDTELALVAEGIVDEWASLLPERQVRIGLVTLSRRDGGVGPVVLFADVALRDGGEPVLVADIRVRVDQALVVL